MSNPEVLQPPLSNNSETVLTVNLNDFNSKTQLYNSDYAAATRHLNAIQQPSISTPYYVTPVIIPKKNPVAQFNRTLLIVPLIAFLLVSAIAITAGVVYGVLTNRNSSSTKQENYAPTYNENLNSGITGSSQSNYPSDSTTPSNTSNSTCGIQSIKPNLQQVRIINGYQAVAHSWPWVVSIGYVGSSHTVLHACGGSLVGKRTIITATHCVTKSSVYSLVGNPDPNSELYKSVETMMRVYIGVSKRSSDITDENTFRAVKITKYPNFDADTFQNDISIVVLDRDIELSDNVGYICLSKNTKIEPDTDVFAVGWGYTDYRIQKTTDDLMQVKFKIQTYDSCGLSYIPYYQFCAGDTDKKKDTCNGDSGGPIMEYMNNKWTLTGIVSNGDAVCSGRGIYTNVAIYVDWILQNIV